jgi:uncharacterized protein YndB with AHSA1/START domain
MSDSPLVDLTRDVEASPATVWSILTTPELFSGWMGGHVVFEAKAGSPFRADFPNFQTVIGGEILEVDEVARRIRMTWGVESGAQAEGFPAGSSIVEFHVLDADMGCRVRVTHGQLPATAEAMEHSSGWRFHLSKMALYANRRDLETGLERTLSGWFAAWNDTNDETRLATLKSCCSDDVEFRDDWTGAQGVELLSTHIMMCFRFMPGWTLQPTGDVRICRGEALVGWRSTGPGGEQDGFNHVRARPDGTILRVTGFPSAPGPPTES